MTDRPLVSVLMPAYNSHETIGRAIGSVLSQGFDDLELIVTDDASTDGTAKLASELAQKDHRVKIVQHGANLGAAAARNSALNCANGRYIAFLDADDEWLPAKLATQIAAMQSHRSPFSFSAYLRDQKGQRRHVSVPSSVSYSQLLRGNVIGCLTAIYDSEYFGKVPMRPIRLRQDYALWLDLLKLADSALGIQEPLAIHYRQRGSLSSNLVANAVGTWRLYRQVEEKSRSQSAYYLLSHYTNRWRSMR